ncbi:MAG: phage tail tape measure protein, partial [Gammaproteobacteria bacterium]|nr:phage tail tape measure protein [Gammaproteobacteria bacterium]
GISIDELLASLATMTTQGIKTSEATSGLKAALANIIKPTKDAEKEAKRLGIEFDAASLRSKGLNKFLQEITSSAEFNQDSFVKLFGSVEGLNAITALTTGNSAKFNEVLGQMQNKSGATKTAFDKMAETLAFQEDQFAALVEVTKIFIGEALTPIVKKLIEFGRVALEAFIGLPEPMRNMITKGAALVGVMVALVSAGAALAAGAKLLIPALVGLAKPLAIAAVVASPLIATFLALRQSFAENEEQANTFGAAMSRIWTTIQNAVSVVMQVFGSFFSGIKAGFQAFITEAKPTIDAFVQALDQLSQSLALESGEAGAQTLRKAGSAGETVGRTFGKVAEVVIRVATAILQIGQGMADAWQTAGDVLEPVFSAFSDVGAEIEKILGSVGALNSSVGSGASAWQAIGSAITTVGGILATG